MQCEKLAAAVCLAALPLATAHLVFPLIPSRVVEVLRCLQLCYPNWEGRREGCSSWWTCEETFWYADSPGGIANV